MAKIDLFRNYKPNLEPTHYEPRKCPTCGATYNWITGKCVHMLNCPYSEQRSISPSHPISSEEGSRRGGNIKECADIEISEDECEPECLRCRKVNVCWMHKSIDDLARGGSLNCYSMQYTERPNTPGSIHDVYRALAACCLEFKEKP